MDYKKIYDNFITSRKQRFCEKEVYYESHHIKPRCLGGLGRFKDHTHENIVRLTMREHFFAHLLLVKIYPKAACMIKAVFMLSNLYMKRNVYMLSSRKYEELRNEYKKNITGVNNPFYGKTHTEEFIKRISEINKGKRYHLGRKLSEAHKKSISDGLKENTPFRDVKVKCLLTGKIYLSARELAEHLNKSHSTIRGYLNGHNKPKPEWFQYERVYNI